MLVVHLHRYLILLNSLYTVTPDRRAKCSRITPYHQSTVIVHLCSIYLILLFYQQINQPAG